MTTEILAPTLWERTIATADQAMAFTNELAHSMLAGWNATPSVVQISTCVVVGILTFVALRSALKCRGFRKEVKRLHGLLAARATRELVSEAEWNRG